MNLRDSIAFHNVAELEPRSRPTGGPDPLPPKIQYEKYPFLSSQ
jgi:hypothetical protein